jgi:hypothetical protein
VEYLRSTSEGGNVDMKAASQWMKSATIASGKDFVSKGGELFHATVGPMDVVLAPAGYVFYEGVGPNDFIGIRCPILSLSDRDALVQISKELLKVEATNSVLQRALDCLTIAA